MRILHLLAAAAILLSAGCSAPGHESDLTTTVDYSIAAPQLSDAVGEVVREPSVPNEKAESGAPKVLHMRLVATKDFKKRRFYDHWRSATRLELLAFAREHPLVVRDRKGVCALGTSYGNPKDRNLLKYPVLSNGTRLGYWSYGCQWKLIVT